MVISRCSMAVPGRPWYYWRQIPENEHPDERVRKEGHYLWKDGTWHDTCVEGDKKHGLFKCKKDIIEVCKKNNIEVP